MAGWVALRFQRFELFWKSPVTFIEYTLLVRNVTTLTIFFNVSKITSFKTSELGAIVKAYVSRYQAGGVSPFAVSK